MKDYKKVYCDHFGYEECDTIPSELSGEPAVHIHHIHRRGMGGDKQKPRIENLMALTFEEHQKYGDLKHYKAFLYTKHDKVLFNLNFKTNFEFEETILKYDTAWIQAQIYKYAFTCPVCQTFNCLNLEHLATYSKLLTSNVR